MNAVNKKARWPLAVSVVCLASTALAQSTNPAITSVRTEGTNLVVTASVPAGVQRLTLETSDRAGRRSWAPRAVMRGDAQPGVVTFRLPMSRPMELIRIRADATEPLPAAFFQGTNAFSSPTDAGSRQVVDAGAGPTAGGAWSGGPTREVVESDIWQLRGNTLYFFNQYRGLQIIDISNPDGAFTRGNLELPAAGDQMYLLGTNHVVLLARDGCSYDQSQVLVVEDTNGPPQVIARLPVSGTITESRLVGTALYVASQTSRPVSGTTNAVWEWGTLVSAFDLANAAKPIARNTLWFSGYGNVVSATDTYLFVITQAPNSWWQSIVNLVDITDPGGATSAYGTIATRGQVLDKFKLDYTDDIFAVISEDRTPTNGVQLVTRLETFHLPDPRAVDPQGIVKLGELELGHGERLHATRFDGSRVYVVTFFQIDPLWVVDFSTPKAPRIAGSVQVPGWSTFIQPLGNRLVTLGIETNHVSVSLYDVSDPAAPTRLSQVRLGANYSWSQANYDEKAFTVLPDAGLVLVPFSGDTTNGYTSALQLIDYSPAALVARGQVRSDSGLSYRRATVAKNRILSLSDWELVSVDATDRDNPLVSGRLDLAESVDRLILAGDYLIQLSTGNWWNSAAPVVSVVAASAPNTVLTRLLLPPLPLLGATKHGDWLYLAQGTPGSSGSGSTEDSKFVLTVATVTNLPALTVIDQTFTNTGPLGWSRDWQALWPQPNVLVWAGGQDFWWWCDMCPVLGGGPVGGISWFWPYWRGSGGNGHLLAFDAANPNAPRLASQADLTATNRWSFSRGFAANGLVYLSHQTSEYVPDPYPTNSGRWIYRSFLDVVDFADPGDPLVRDPVNIPNPLVGVADSGALLFTLGSHWETDPNTMWRDYLDASAYDNVNVYLQDSLALPTVWPHPSTVVGANVLLGVPGDNNPTNTVSSTLDTWALSTERKFIRLGSLKVASPLSDLTSFPGLVAGPASDGSVNLFDATDPAALRLVGAGRLPLCWWWPDFHHSDGSLSAGLWLPLSAYGVAHIPVQR
ncbi:MAG TPA: beta-propeller domain-containing protein [Verrucomicrobiae bacterium]